MKRWVRGLYITILKTGLGKNVNHINMFRMSPHVAILLTSKKAEEYSVQKFINDLDQLGCKVLK